MPFDIDILARPVFEQVSPPKVRATASKEDLISAVRSVLSLEVNAEFDESHVETMLKFGLGQGPADNLQLVGTAARLLGEAHRAKVARLPFTADPRIATFKRRAEADGNAANLGRTEPFDV